MLLPSRGLALAAVFAALQAAAPPTQQPPGGPPLPWAVVSIHINNSDQVNDHWGDQPDGFSGHDITLRDLISTAYAFSVMPFRADEISGLPAWADSTHFDVLARVDPDDVPAFKKLSDLSMADTIAAFSARQPTGEMLMMQHLLTDRFALRVHWQPEERSVYLLKVAKDGLRMKPAADTKHGEMNFTRDHLSGKGVPLTFLASLFSNPAGRIVVDQTGITGAYDFDLHFDPENDPKATSTEPGFFRALEEQLGLTLQSAHVSVPVLVVDHVEQPTPN